MEIPGLCETGMTTSMNQESFSRVFTIPNFIIEEIYEMMNDGNNLRRKVTFPKVVSSAHVIGQTIGFPSEWNLTLSPNNAHVRVGFTFAKFFGDNNNVGRTVLAVLKLRMSIVDKDGCTVHRKDWRSWGQAVSIGIGEDYGMPDFIHLHDFFDNRDLLFPEKTLRIFCEGVIYGSFIQSQILRKIKIHYSHRPFRGLLEQGDKHADIQLVSKCGKRFKTHKLALSKSSRVFENLFQTVILEDGMPSLHCQDLADSEVSAVLEYIYTGDIDADTRWSDLIDVERLMKIASDYEVRGLKGLCCSKLVTRLTCEAFPRIATIFRKMQVDTRCHLMLYNYFIMNQTTLLASESFKTFAAEDTETFLYAVLSVGK